MDAEFNEYVDTYGSVVDANASDSVTKINERKAFKALLATALEALDAINED